MFPGVDGEILSVMVEGRRGPCILVMTGGTIRWELGSGVVGVGGLIIVGQMASHTGTWGGVIIPVVTGGTVVGNGGMSALKNPVIVVY